MSGTMVTKRRYPRLKRRVRVHYGPPETSPKKHASITGDVSETGLYVQAMRAEPPGTRLDLDVDLPGGEVLLRGIVVWSREGNRLARYTHGGFGVWLLDPPEAWRRYWRDEIQAHERRSATPGAGSATFTRRR